MKCFKCGKPARFVIPSLEEPACDNCYSRVVEKRFAKNVKGLTSVKLSLNRPSDFVLQFLFKRRGVNTLTGRRVKQFTLDDLCVSILKSFFTNKNQVLKEFSPLSNISEEELINYSIIHDLPFKGNKRSGINADIHSFLMKLNKRRPGVMYSIKSFLE